MRHRNYGKKLSRNTSHRRALMRNLVTSLILGERIETTVAKAKAARPVVEQMITLGKRGDLHARRLAAAYLLDPAALELLFGVFAQRYAERRGGYTRLVRTGWRKGDGADLAVLELVGSEVLQKLAEKRAKKRKPSRRRRKKPRPKSRRHRPKRTRKSSRLMSQAAFADRLPRVSLTPGFRTLRHVALSRGQRYIALYLGRDTCPLPWGETSEV